MDEMLKEIMGEAYKADMTSDELQSFFKNQVLGSGAYVNRDAAEAEKRKLQNALDAKDAELKSRMTDDEKKAADDKALQEQIAELKKQLAQGKINASQVKAMGITAKSRLNSGIADDDKEFGDFINLISTEDDKRTSKIANYINKMVEQAYNKGKSDATKNKLGQMGNLNSADEGASNADLGNADLGARLARQRTSEVRQNTYFK